MGSSLPFYNAFFCLNDYWDQHMWTKDLKIKKKTELLSKNEKVS